MLADLRRENAAAHTETRQEVALSTSLAVFSEATLNKFKLVADTVGVVSE